MTVRVGLIAALTVATLAWPVAAQGQAGAADKEAAQMANDNEIVCKYQANTGTRFRSKTCKTRGQWEQMRIQQQRDAKEFMDKPTINTNRG